MATGGTVSPSALVELLSSAVVLLGRTGLPHQASASMLLAKNELVVSGSLLQAINDMLIQVQSVLGEEAPDAEEFSISPTPPSPVSMLSGDDISSDSSTKKLRAAVPPPVPTRVSTEESSQVVVRTVSPLDKALARLCTPSVTTGFMIVSGIPLSMPAKTVFENIEDILGHYGVPLDANHLKEFLGLHPVKAWSGRAQLANVQLAPTLDSGVREDAIDDSGSLAIKLQCECTFGDVSDSSQNKFLRVLSAYGASFKCGERKFHPLLHFNPIAEEAIGHVLDDNSALFMIRGGTGVDATDSFLAARVASISETIDTGHIHVSVEGVRRVHKVYGFSKDGRTSMPLSRYCTEIVFMVRLLSPPFGKLREQLYDTIRRLCLNRTGGWISEEDRGVLETCPALWMMMPDELVVEIYAAHYTRYLDVYRSHYSYPHLARGAPRSVSLVAIRSLQYTPLSLADFLSALHDSEVDLSSICCAYPFPPLRHTEPSSSSDKPYSINYAQLRMVIIWAGNIGRSLPPRIQLPSEEVAPLLVTAEPTNHLPGFWNAGEQSTSKLYLNGFLRRYYNQFQDSSSNVRQGLAPVRRFLEYNSGATATAARSSKKGAGTFLPSPTPTSSHSTPQSMASRLRSTTGTSSSAVIPAPPARGSNTSSAVAIPGDTLDLGALISSINTLSSQFSEVRNLQVEQLRRINDLERRSKK